MINSIKQRIKMYQGTEELKEMQESVKDFIKFHYIPKTLSKRMVILKRS